MGQADFLRVGDYNAICDVCGRKFKFSRLRQKWDNTWACEQDWEPRQPQDYLKGIKDNMSVPLSRPDPPASYVDTIYVNPITSNISLSFALNRVKSYLANVASNVTILVNLYPKSTSGKVVNTFVLNATTLG
jgi:hypothetical protein